MNNYSKPVSNTSVPVDQVEAWLDKHPYKRAENQPNGGIIRATSAVTFVDMLTRAPSSPAQKKKLIAKAQRENKQALKKLAKREGAGRPKVTTDMPTKRGQQILEQMKEKGFYDVADFELSQTYLSNIISQMRELGYTVNIITGKKQKAVRYVLDKQ